MTAKEEEQELRSPSVHDWLLLIGVLEESEMSRIKENREAIDT